MVGDILLKEVADAIKSNVRETDYVIRMGGDELMVGFTGMKKERLMRKLENIRTSVEEIHLSENKDIHVTVSIGGTFCNGYTDDAREQADLALYEGKKIRNTVVIYKKSDEEEEKHATNKDK